MEKCSRKNKLFLHIFTVQGILMISSNRPARRGRWRPHFPAKISGKFGRPVGLQAGRCLGNTLHVTLPGKEIVGTVGIFFTIPKNPREKCSIGEESNKATTTSSNQILRLPSPVEQWRPIAAAKGEKNKWRTRGEKTHLAQCRRRGGRGKKIAWTEPWRVGSRSCEPASQLWRYQPTPSFSCRSFLNDGGRRLLIGSLLRSGSSFARFCMAKPCTATTNGR